MGRNSATLPPGRSFYADTSRFVSLTVILVAVSTFLTFSRDHALATHVACGDTITTDTMLDSDLIDCPSNGIIIGADDITLDLNGHMIDGDNALVDQCPEDEFCDVGIANDGHDGVTITNGTMRQFAIGVFLLDVGRNRVRRLSTVHNVFSGILLVRAVHTRVRGSFAARNAGPDSGVGIVLFRSHNNRITNNTATVNAELGIHLIRSDRNYVGRNRVRRNPEDGIVLDGDGNKIVRNRVVRNSITITKFTGGVRPADNVVRRNRVRRAPAGGISVDPAAKDTVLRRNHVFRAGGHGILVGGRAMTLSRNRVRGSGGDGFAVRENADHSLLRRNIARGNGDDGFDVESPSTKVRGNRAVRNADLGIEAVPGVIDGGGNIARNNGDPRQCINISCG